MTVIAIVGSSKIPYEMVYPHVERIISERVNSRDIVVSGGARGVDTAVRDVCRERGITFEEFLPRQRTPEEYLARDRRIAECANIIIVIAVKGSGCYHHGEIQSPTHDRTGGCYTARCGDPSDTVRFLYIIDPETGVMGDPEYAWAGISGESISAFQRRIRPQLLTSFSDIARQLREISLSTSGVSNSFNRLVDNQVMGLERARNDFEQEYMMDFNRQREERQREAEFMAGERVEYPGDSEDESS